MMAAALTLWLCSATLGVNEGSPTAPSAAMEAPGWLDEPAAAAPHKVNSRVGAVAGLVGGSAAMLGIYALGLRRGRGRKGDLSDARSIELLALRPLGGKQRLALVAVCGERLLLAANDREVTLLSHLPAPESRAEIDAGLPIQPTTPAGTAVAPTAPSIAPGATVAAMEAALHAADAAAAPSAVPFAEDLAGLHLWRRELHAAEERA